MSELAEHSYSSLYPVWSIVFSLWSLYVQYEICWMPCCAQSSPSLSCLIHRTFISRCIRSLILSHRLKPDNWHLAKENFWITFFQVFFIIIPLSSFKVQSTYKCTIFGSFMLCILILVYFIIIIGWVFFQEFKLI